MSSKSSPARVESMIVFSFLSSLAEHLSDSPNVEGPVLGRVEYSGSAKPESSDIAKLILVFLEKVKLNLEE